MPAIYESHIFMNEKNGEKIILTIQSYTINVNIDIYIVIFLFTLMYTLLRPLCKHRIR